MSSAAVQQIWANARALQLSGDGSAALKEWVRAHTQEPAAWWSALEALRILRQQSKTANRSIKKIAYSPDYAGNSYQRNLYSQSARHNFTTEPMNTLHPDARAAAITLTKGSIFHQHWLKEIYWSAKDVAHGMRLIASHISTLRALKLHGVPIIWTLHNLMDHDASPLQAMLCRNALGQMATLSDAILLHHEGAREELETICGSDLGDKSYVIPHPLYSDLLQVGEGTLPQELKPDTVKGKRIYLFAGMIRPYKGVPDLLRAFDRLLASNPQTRPHLIVAGHMLDPDVNTTLEKLSSTTRANMTLVFRRLTDSEIVALTKLADVSVTPYRHILTSGSYYLTTTFSKPTLAPDKGMFRDLIKSGVNGFTYDGTPEALARAVIHINQLPSSNLERVGRVAHEACQSLTTDAISERYFSLINRISCGD